MQNNLFSNSASFGILDDVIKNSLPTIIYSPNISQPRSQNLTDGEINISSTQQIISSLDRGWYDSSGYHNPFNHNYAVGTVQATNELWRNWMAFALPTFTNRVISAQLIMNVYSVMSDIGSETYQLRDVTTPLSTLINGGSGLTSIYDDLGDGTIYGSRVFTPADSNTFVTIDLNQNFLNAINENSGGSMALGGHITTLDNIPNNEYIFGYSGRDPINDIRLVLTYESTGPINPDNFVDRIDLGSVDNITVQGSNIGATGEVGEPAQSGTINSVWWKWTASNTGMVTIDTNGSDFDTYLSVFTGSAVNNLTVIQQDDDGGSGLDSLVSFLAQQGVEYQIAVDGFSRATGNITLNLDWQPYFGGIQGTIWNDVNGNAIQDTGENPLPNWSVYLDQNLNGRFDTGETTTVTDTNGNYSFQNLAPGTYVVAEVIPSGWRQTYPQQFNPTSTTTFDSISSSSFVTQYNHDHSINISPRTQKPTPNLNADYKPGELIIKFRNVVSTHELNSLRAELGATVLQSVGNLGLELWSIKNMSVEEAIALHGKSPLVEYIEPNYIISINDINTQTSPNDPSYTQLWGLNNTGQTGGTVDADIDAPEAWDITTGSSNIVVGVIDTGIDYTHPDLVNNMWINTGEIPGNGIDDEGNGYIDDIHGYDFAYDDGDPMDVHGHGTHAAGTIGGQGNNAVGVAGVNWNVRLMALRFLDDEGFGTTFNAIRAVNYATTMGVRITNNSWGGGRFSQALYDAIDAARNAGQLFVAAAGNNINDNDRFPFYPASYDLNNIISVAATDHNDQLAWFSNYGATTVDLAAPGVNIYSTLPNNGYGSSDGTSMASPHVAGVAALLLARNPNLTYGELKAAILSGVDVKANLTGTNLTGGRLNAHQALINSVPVPGTHTVRVTPGQMVQGINFGNQQISLVDINISGNQTIVEGMNNPQNVVITVTLSQASSQIVTVQYATANGSAIADSDYTTTTGTLTFNAGETSKTINIPILNDNISEPNETFTVTLSNPTNGNITSSTAIVTITDTLQSEVTTTLASGVENLTLTGTGDINGTGNLGNNIITGNSGNNFLSGDGGNDTLDGDGGNDTLDGGTGADSMEGRLGNDTYFVDDSDDTVIERINEGVDTVTSTLITYTLPNHVENLTLSGTADINGTGNVLNNLITGNSGNNHLNGGGHNDTLMGGVGNDTLVGDAGIDSMVGGVGNDAYYVDTTNDLVVEWFNEGIDTIFSSVNYTLPHHVENLILTGTANSTGRGNSLDNLIIGNAGNNRFDGGGGNDTLDGGTGADSMEGRLGNDTYSVDNSDDTVIERINEGVDTVTSTLITYTLPRHVENLTLSGTADINGTGNALNNLITGNSGNNHLNGGGHRDTLMGGVGNDTLVGGAGIDSMVGGVGNDTYHVDRTNDLVVEWFNEGIDTIFSSVNYTLPHQVENLTLSGTANSMGIGNSLDNLIIGNVGNNRLGGGGGNDALMGDAGNDILIGGAGNDTLTGGAGADFFRFNSPTEGIDGITDFNVGEDMIHISRTGFGSGLPLGVLSSARFLVGSSATTPNHRFFYDSSNGGLFFDVDGSGATSAVQIATLNTSFAFTHQQITVV